MENEFSKFSLDLVSIINNTGGEARFVGGCVRDSLIGKPFKDIDIATNLLPQDVVDLLQENNIKTIPTGIKHGTITAVKNNEAIEITTLRKDVECDGRYAEVEFTDKWLEDAARRDFTFNAIYIDADGKLHDPFNGIEDLNSGIVKFIREPEDRIKEDYLRIPRFFRFCANYSNDIQNVDNDVLSVISENTTGLDNVSAERIKAEFFKIIASEQSPTILSLMEKTDVLQKIIPIDEHKIQNLHNLISTDDKANHLTRLACLINDDSSEKRDKNIGIVTESLALSNTEKKCLKAILEPKHTVDFDISLDEQKKAIRILGAKDYKNILLLKASTPEIFNDNKIINKLENLLSFADTWVVPRLPMNGVDLLKAGFKEGKEIGELLKKAEEHWESKEYKMTKSELLEHLGVETREKTNTHRQNNIANESKQPQTR